GRRPWSFALGGLQVWSVQTRVALPKIGRLTPGVARRQRPLIFPYTAESGVVLQVLTDPRQMLHHRDAVSLQVGLLADARLHQHLGSVDRAQRQHHLRSRTHAVELAVLGELHAGGPVALQRHSGHQRTGENREVGPVHIRENIRAEYGLPVSVAGSHFEKRRAALALHHPTVLTLEGWNPHRAGTVERGGGDRTGGGR